MRLPRCSSGVEREAAGHEFPECRASLANLAVELEPPSLRGVPARSNSSFTPSAQSTAACFDSAAKPPTALVHHGCWNVAIWARVLPVIHSVSAEPAAMMPCSRGPCSAPRPPHRPANRAERRQNVAAGRVGNLHHHAGGASSPTLRGFRKCSMRRGGYILCSNRWHGSRGGGDH